MAAETAAPPALVIFDCDGVLVDSETINARVLTDFLNAHGAALTVARTVALFTGRSRFAVERHMSENGTPLPADWAGDFYPRAFDAFKKELQTVPGAKALLERLGQAGVPFCVASNAMHSKLKLTLGLCGLSELVRGAVYSAYDVAAPKPAPDVFLHAARCQGARPGTCVIVEDSRSGFEAARRAGMRCLAYRAEPGMAAEHGAIPFADMADVPRLLGLGD